jgi:tetratricopeptide (TPR) repeat protein
LHVEGERVAATGDLEAQRAFLGKLKPPAGKSLNGESTPYEFFMDRLHKSGRLQAFLERLLETPADHVDFPFHAEAIHAVPWYLGRTGEHNELRLRLKAKEKGAEAVVPQDWIWLAEQFAREKKFGLARAAALRALEGRSVTGEQRASAEIALARGHLDAGEWPEALGACDRGLAATKTQGLVLHLLRTRACLGSGDAPGAAKDATAAVGVASGWAAEIWAARDLLDAFKRWPARIETADPFVLAVAREAKGDLAGAAEALEKREGSLAGALERMRLRLASGDLAKAVEARVELMPMAAAASDRKAGRGIDGLEDLEKKLCEACVRSDAWEALKALGRGLAREPGYHGRRLDEILQAVCEPEYLEEIEAIGLKAATTPEQRGWAVQPAILAAYRLGWTAEGERRLRGVTVERGFSASMANLAAEWLLDFERPEIRVVDPLEETRRHAEERPDHPGPYRDLGHIPAERLDRAWRGRLRGRSADPIALRVGALRGRTREERIACAERILREASAPAAWKALIGEILMDTGADDVAVTHFGGMIRAPEERAAAIDALRILAPRLSKGDRARLIEELDAIEACGWAWELGKPLPATIPARLLQLERWHRRAAPGGEMEHAGRALADVLEAQARLLQEAGEPAGAAGLLVRALEVGDPERAPELRLRLMETQAAVGDAQAVLQSSLALRTAFLDDEQRTTLRKLLLDVSQRPGFWTALKRLPLAEVAPEIHERIRRDLAALRDEDIGVREAAAQALRGDGRSALPALLDSMDEADVEVRSRVRGLILDALAGR